MEAQKAVIEKSLNKYKTELKETKDTVIRLKEEMDQSIVRLEKELDDSRDQVSKSKYTVNSL